MRILYHGNCLDGCSSAGLFARFYRERVAGSAPVDLSFLPLEHRGEAQAFPESCFTGDENACVDFRYSQDPRLTWWFDHHASAFQLPGDEDHFRADATGRKFYDPKAKSCTRFLAETVAEKFGFDKHPLGELLEWAEIVDGALFKDARMAVELKEPALRLMTWVENNRQPELADRFIMDLVSRPLADIAADPYVAEPLGPLLEKHQRTIDVVRRAARFDHGVVFFDLTGEDVGPFNKFISYYLFPEARYAVALTSGPRLKISVGSNPWSLVPRTHDIAALCQRYGGGGHPVVGAVNMPKSDLDRARTAASEIVAALSQ